jgi:MOSC domain-containing protein YiiM
VIATGRAKVGDPVSYERAGGTTLGIVEFSEMYYADDLSRAQLERALAAPICERGRRAHERQLEALLRSP